MPGPRHSRRALLRGLVGAVAGTGVAATGALAGCVAPPRSRDALDPLAPTALDREAFTQFRLGLRNHGHVDRSIPSAVAVDWTLPVNRGEHTAAKSTPVRTPDGDVVIAGDTGAIRRVTPAGEVRWTSHVDPVTRGIHGTPAIANGQAYVGAYDGALYAFDLATGERRWRTDLGGSIGSSPAYFNGVVYIAVEYPIPSGSVAAVDAADGDVLWMDHRPSNHPHSTVAIDHDAGRLVVGDNDGVCYAWTFPGLERVWTYQTGGPIKGPVATFDGLAVFGSWDHHVYALHLDDGSLAWSFETGADVMSGPAVDPGGTVYVGSHDSTLYALDGRTGEERWRFETGNWIIGGVTSAREHVLFGSYDDRFYAVEKATGEESWHVTGNANATSAALVTDDAVYYAERGSEATPGNLYRLVPA